jgi:hypothetical protein
MFHNCFDNCPRFEVFSNRSLSRVFTNILNSLVSEHVCTYIKKLCQLYDFALSLQLLGISMHVNSAMTLKVYSLQNYYMGKLRWYFAVMELPTSTILQNLQFFGVNLSI